MATEVGIGRSVLRDPQSAARQAVSEALTSSGMDGADFVLMFATVGYDQQLLVKSVREASGGAVLSGCSAEGVIVQDGCDESNFALAVLLFRSDEIRFHAGLSPGPQAEAEQLGATVARQVSAAAGADARALFLFPDGLTVDFDGLRQGLEDGLQLEPALPIFGGTAGDNWSWVQTYQYHDDDVISDGVAWAVMSGDAHVATAVNHGCVGLGVQHVVTRSEGTTIYEIDGRRALEVMHQYMTSEEMQDWGRATIHLPLAFEVPEGLGAYDPHLIRVMLTKDDETGAVTIPTRVRPGTRLWIARRDFDKVISGVGTLAADLNAQFAGAIPKVVLQFECAGRGRTFLREEQKLELVRQLHQQVPPTTWFGFYTYGEIGPVAGQNSFHNYTSVLAAIL
jgi:hypothetical protein